MQNNSIRILCTRPLSQELIRLVEGKGFTIDVVPFIRTEMIISDEVANRMVTLSALPAAVIFTSMNAADAVISQLNGIKPLWRIFCLGNSTRKILTRYFGEALIAGIAHNAASLAETIIATGNTEKVAFFCGDQRRDELPLKLDSVEIEVEELVVYRTINLENLINQHYQAILFFSPSAVSSFFSRNMVGADTIFFAIGETTADEIKRYCENKIVIASDADKDVMVDTMLNYFEAAEQLRIANRN